MIALAVAALAAAPPLWVTYEGIRGPGLGKKIVLLAGDEEYRSEEALPQLAKILAFRHGFTCTVLFSVDEDGHIAPDLQTNQPGTQALDEADLCIMMLRFRHWPDSQMKPFVEYVESGRPIMALRTSTHAFAYPAESKSPYKKYGWDDKDWPGGFGKAILGETWKSHWGKHGVEGTAAVPAMKPKLHPILKGFREAIVPTDVYEARPPANASILLNGLVLKGLDRQSGLADYEKSPGIKVNARPMPVMWLQPGLRRRTLTTTMGSAQDLLDESFRRVLVNGCFYLLNMKIPDRAAVDLMGPYQPTPFGFGGYKKGVRPADLAFSIN